MDAPPPQVIRIESREHLLSTVAEAAELEHTVMCLYLYAVFSLKQSEDEGLSSSELAAVTRWRGLLMEVALQEMTHLVLVANLTTAIGGTAHFYRPAFPVQPGCFPPEFVVGLAPFSLETLDQFIFLERPDDQVGVGGKHTEPGTDYVRATAPGRLMAHPGDYHTVGQLYKAIEQGLERLSGEREARDLFCGSRALQLTPSEVPLEGLRPIYDKTSALAALQTIVDQGEGARVETNSHFETFTRIKNEFRTCLARNPEFAPSRPTASNPVMRHPVDSGDTVWVNDPTAARYLDLGNSLYVLMLRCLVQLYAMERRPPSSKKVLLDGALTLMHAVARIASVLSQMPANPDLPNLTAGLSFDLNRHLSPLELSSEKVVLVERLREITGFVDSLQQDAMTSREHRRIFSEIGETLGRIRGSLVNEETEPPREPMRNC
jgi:hypothetical protein